MITLGITGSVGMGKSTLSRLLEEMGCPVHDSDQAVHEALSPKGRAFEEVAVTFPDAWDKKTHRIDRATLGALVFNDPEKRAMLESIVHPAVWASQDEFRLKHTRLGTRCIAFDIPLLFETGADAKVDYTIVASAPYPIQRRRVLSRTGMTEEKFQAILAAQMPDRDKRQRADFVVETGLGLAHSRKILADILREVTG